MTLEDFIETANPRTLASFVADIQMLGTGATPEQLRWDARAALALACMVGGREADRLVRMAFRCAERRVS